MCLFFFFLFKSECISCSLTLRWLRDFCFLKCQILTFFHSILNVCQVCDHLEGNDSEFHSLKIRYAASECFQISKITYYSLFKHHKKKMGYNIKMSQWTARWSVRVLLPAYSSLCFNRILISELLIRWQLFYMRMWRNL